MCVPSIARCVHYVVQSRVNFKAHNKAQEKLDSMKKTEFGAKLFEGLTAELLMTKWNGRLEELVTERVELMKKDKREAQDKIRKQERSVSISS